MKNSMPALVNYARDPLSVEVRELPVPEIGDEDVLLRVGAVSICGSDLHQWRGSHSWKVNYPCVLGNEFAGTVAATCARVRSFKEGDRVICLGKYDNKEFVASRIDLREPHMVP